MSRIGLVHKMSRHLGVSVGVADKLVNAGYVKPGMIKVTTKRKLREDAGLTQKEVNDVKARWS